MGALYQSMKFEEKFTTQELIDKDTTGKEQKKSPVTNDAYAIGLMLQKIIYALRFSK